MNDLREILPGEVVEIVEAIGADNRSGAAEILQKAATAYRVAAQVANRQLPAKGLRQQADCITSALRQAQPDMAGVLNLAREVDKAVASSGSAPLEAAATAAAHFSESASRKAAASSEWGAKLINDNAVVLTHSRSSTVLSALLWAAAAGRVFRLITTESRPMLEGRQLAETVATHGISVTYIVDAAAAAVMDKVTLVLVGADRVTPERVLNKIGTKMIALAARMQQIPIYCLADTSKFIEGLVAGAEPAEASAAEVWPDAPADISVLNNYFEEVPLVLFSGIITENGLLRPEQAARLAADSAISNGAPSH